MAMKKFINDPKDLTKELLEGLALSNPSRLTLTADGLVVSKSLGDMKRVHIVTIAGTGHEPAISGFVGKGMVDIGVPGDIFAAPGPNKCVEAIKMACDASKGAGVLFVVLNHSGDMMSGNMAMEMAEELKLNVRKLVTQEDISNAPRSDAGNRRGLVGALAMYKMASAASREGKSLDQVYDIAEKFSLNMATLAVAMRGATHPQTGDFISVFAEDEMEIGMGQHGEGGGQRTKIKTADETATIMCEALCADLGVKSGERLMVIVNGSGSTTLMEQLIVFRKVHRLLEGKGVTVVASWVDEILTVQEAAGFQLCLARMDDQLLEYWNAPCDAPYLRVVG